MEARELMIGDWIHVSSPLIDSNVKVDLHTLSMMELEQVIMEYQPIPLTAEILEKNGFAYDEDGSNFDRIYMKNDDGNLVVDITGEDSFVGFVCKYVHQLQQALRLCGISKEIQL